MEGASKRVSRQPSAVKWPEPEHRTGDTGSARRWLIRAAIVLSIFCVSACGSDSATPTTPSSSAIAGTWTGTFADNLVGANPTTWTIQQSGNAFTSAFTVQAPAATARGTTQGALSGATITWTGVIPLGGYPSPFQNCTQSASGTLQLSGNRMTGPYSMQLGSGCSPPNISTTGTLTLNKQ